MSSFTSSQQFSPNKSQAFNRNSSAVILEQSHVASMYKSTTRRTYLWAPINLFLIFIIWYDLQSRCPFYFSYILYVEYFLLTLFSVNLLYHIACYLKFSKEPPIPGLCTPSSPKSSSNFIDVSSKSTFSSSYIHVANVSISNSPSLNTSISPISWRYNTPFKNDNVKNTSSSATTPGQFLDGLTSCFPYKFGVSPGNEEDAITSEHSLSEYLKQYNAYELNGSLLNGADQTNKDNTMNTFWSHPNLVTKTNDISNFLRKCQYQLSPTTTGSASNSPGVKSKSDPSSPEQLNLLGTEMWRRFQVDSLTLTQWNENIRLWLSKTIIERLVNQIDQVDDALQKQGLVDIRLGQVGLDRLKKTAQLPVVLQTVPTLLTLVSFLELTTSQEYLVKRLRELSKGGCISAFKWNGGSSYNDKEWDDSLPTDSAIIMHLFATYMDTQLLPSPNEPDIKPFSGNHFIKITDTKTIPNSVGIAIHECSQKPPHYRLLVGKEIFEMVKGYNNLFHTILLFLYHVNKREAGMLRRTNLGKAGINILWVIDS